MKPYEQIDRRNFLTKSTTIITGGALGLGIIPNGALGAEVISDELENVIGPREGFSPQIGTLLSMMTWMRATILYPVNGMSVKELDYQHDDKSNTIGAMLLHLAATERYYQIDTFEGKKREDWSPTDNDKFGVAMELGDEGRNKIKGNSLDFYLNTLNEVRENTITEFRKRDDKWLMAIDQDWFWGPTNNYCKWFHVCEHESNHNGQIKWIKGRLPQTK